MASAEKTPDAEVREKLLKNVKKEVKQIMEEAVTRKFIHEESSTITALCGVVESCLLHGLKKRALGLFKNSTTVALLQKVSKNCEAAAQVLKLSNEIESSSENGRKSLDTNKNLSARKSTYSPRYMWIRLALFEKQLAKIIDHLCDNCSKFYEKEALLSDPVDGPILASLLVGPCALDYTKMKTPDHYWTDPPADELVQRHRIHSSGPSHHIRADSPKRPGLQVRRNTSSSSEESMRAVPVSAKDYVESLHQNNKSTLLYGKNNVMVQPKEDLESMAGYLSLHQGPEGMTVKWTPNQLMNGSCEKDDADSVDRSTYWDYAVTVYIEEIVYLHCHQQPDRGGTIVLVGQDGVQRPPIHFPKGGHLLAFLSCLENGLLPHGQLDPPLWSQRGKARRVNTEHIQSSFDKLFNLESAPGIFAGKVFPKLKRKGSRLSSNGVSKGSPTSGPTLSQEKSKDGDSGAGSGAEEEEATDYVFRIISSFRPENLTEDMLDPKAPPPEKNGMSLPFTLPWESTSSTSSASNPSTPTPRPQVMQPALPPGTIQTYAKSQQVANSISLSKSHAGHRSAVRQLCDTMKRQILSRAFYGWLSHCRHLKTVRTHLSGLVNTTVISIENPTEASQGLTLEVWRKMSEDGVVKDAIEVYRLVYYGGCQHECRKEVWPYLLGHYEFGSSQEDRDKADEAIQQQYEKTMSEWLAVEAIVRQRDKEIMAANLAKLSQESQDGHIPLVRKDSSLSNDVFESMDSDDFSHPETVPEESSSAVTPTTEPDQEAPVLPSVLETQPTPKGSTRSTDSKDSPDDGLGDSIARGSSLSESRRSDSCDTDRHVSETLRSESDDPQEDSRRIIVTNPSIDVNGVFEEKEEAVPDPGKLTSTSEDGDHLLGSRESLASPISNASNGGIYSPELLDSVALNLHRIDKDVQRCDRNYPYFTPPNLDKLRNIMCTYVWENLDIGYVQGMCDLVAPLLVIFDDEAMTYSCFNHLMKRMTRNFPHGGAMDTHFANMRSLIQILDPELFEHMHQNGDYTHFYFCYRWFLLDFKRELIYEDVFAVWEVIWAAKYISSPHFVLFIALALVEYYREIIMDNNMDFTDIIKFFNEMAERHNAKQVLGISRDLVYKLQDLIENK